MNVFPTLHHIYVVFYCAWFHLFCFLGILSNKYSNIFLEGFYVVSPKIDGKSLEKFRFFIEVCIENTYFNCWAAFLYTEFLYLILSGSAQSTFYLSLFCAYTRMISIEGVKWINHNHSYSTKNNALNGPD